MGIRASATSQSRTCPPSWAASPNRGTRFSSSEPETSTRCAMTWPRDCIHQREPLANHTSFRIGGMAEWFAEPSTLDELVAVLREASSLGLPVSVVGGGTNTLGAYRGVRGLVLHLGQGFRTIHALGDPDGSTAWMSCGAALLTQRLVFLAAKHG